MSYGAGIAVSISGHSLISIGGGIDSAVYEFAASACHTYCACLILTLHGSFSRSVPTNISTRPATATHQFVYL